MHFRLFLILWFCVGNILTACWGNISITNDQHCSNEECSKPEICPHKCDSNATCIYNNGSPTCTCNQGYSGDGLTCTDTDECQASNGGCDRNAVCVNTQGSHQCICQPWFISDGPLCSLSGHQKGAPWPMEGGNTQHTKQSSYIGAQTDARKWSPFNSRKVDGASDTDQVKSATIDKNGTIYFISGDNLHAVNPDGKSKWIFPIEGNPEDNYNNSVPAIAVDDTIYVGGCDGKLHAVTPDGKEKWSFLAGGCISSPAIGADDTIYFETGEKLYALDPKNPSKEKWFFSVGARISSPVIGADGIIYFVSKDRHIYALDPKAPKEAKWSENTGNENRMLPAISADGTIYLSTVDLDTDNQNYDVLYAFNSDNGERKWVFRVPKEATSKWFGSEPAIGADGTVYWEGTNHILYAVSPDGKEKWSYQKTGDDWFVPSPVIGADGIVYTGGNKLYAFTPDGKLKWSYGMIGLLRSTPAIGADGTVYIGSNDGNLYAFGPR